MKSSIRNVVFFTLILIVTTGIAACQIQDEKSYFAVEQDGVICGYGETTVSKIMKDGKEMMLIESDVQAQISALGADVDTKVHIVFHVDPKTGKFFYHESDIEQGSVRIGSTIVVDGDVAHVVMKPEGKKKDVVLPADIVLENDQIFPHLIKDFIKAGMQEKIYKVFDTLDCEVQEKRYTKKGLEELELAGKKYNALVLDELNLKTGLKMIRWFNVEDGSVLKMKHPIRTIFLTDSSVRNKIQRVSVDNHIFAKVNAGISDLTSISYMKVKASLEPTGSWITPESLNLPGQRFEGTVKENAINGIFEVSLARYDGNAAPPFPPDFSKDTSMKRYLEPEDFIESDDPVLVEKAREITKGSKDSWEAAQRLTTWVAHEIGYDIPGGGTARNTYDLKEAECGGHSRLLAAFCRAVGIPARVVWGCMYVPNLGGAFGQHGWNEIYMGKAGWIQVDATAKEIGYADSGHIRLGELSSKSISLQPKKMEILDFQAGSQKMGMKEVAEVPENLKRYMGSYRSPSGSFKILFRNGNLAVDVPGQTAFELNEPDAEGWWFFKVTDTASISFQEDAEGKVVSMTLWSRTRMPKRESAEDMSADVPEKYRSYLGKYPVPMQNMDLTVLYTDGNLAVNDPNYGDIKLKGPDEKGLWIDQFDKNKISFDVDESGNAKAMIFHQILQFPKE